MANEVVTAALFIQNDIDYAATTLQVRQAALGVLRRQQRRHLTSNRPVDIASPAADTSGPGLI